ncbi:hypothetical protein BUH_7288 [Burkholderia pseudomallei Pakistan 9]|nr:hypothetical protein BUH_7288 [Burkholderia pseudomallei Pakistan 9]
MKHSDRFAKFESTAGARDIRPNASVLSPNRRITHCVAKSRGRRETL